MTQMLRFAPAKLNLFLHLTGKRTDGYHLLDSLVVFLDVADRLTIAPGDALSLTVNGAFAEAAGDVSQNLVLRAARALQQATGATRGAALHLEKHIPVGAGLGGGSSDAAAALLGLNDHWQLGLDAPALAAIAAPLGADVPMCLAGISARVGGIGEVIAPLAEPLPALPLLLAHPRLPLSTPDVYRAVTPADIGDEAALDTAQHITTTQALAAILASTRNDLTAPACRVQPAVAHVLAALAAPSPTLVRMSGSGACCFALYPHAAERDAAVAGLQASHPEWWVAAANLRSSG